MNFAQVSALTIPEGEAVSITRKSDGAVLWTRTDLLPRAYRQVEYIETDGNQYVDTGVLASDHTDGIKYVMRGFQTGILATGMNNWFFGCLADGRRSGNYTCYSDYSQRFFIGKSTSGYIHADVIIQQKDFTIEAFGSSEDALSATCSVNGTALNKANIVNDYACAMPEATIYLMRCNGALTGASFYGKLYSFTMDTADGTPIRNFVPCYRVEDGVIGLYDTVEGTFYENAGTGSFTKGADVTT